MVTHRDIHLLFNRTNHPQCLSDSLQKEDHLFERGVLKMLYCLQVLHHISTSYKWGYIDSQQLMTLRFLITSGRTKLTATEEQQHRIKEEACLMFFFNRGFYLDAPRSNVAAAQINRLCVMRHVLSSVDGVTIVFSPVFVTGHQGEPFSLC